MNMPKLLLETALSDRDAKAVVEYVERMVAYVAARPTTNTRLDKDEFKKDDPATLVDRLLGLYPVPVPGQYKTAPVQHEAAREIERLREEVKRLTPVYLKPSEYPPLFSHDMYE